MTRAALALLLATACSAAEPPAAAKPATPEPTVQPAEPVGAADEIDFDDEDLDLDAEMNDVVVAAAPRRQAPRKAPDLVDFDEIEPEPEPALPMSLEQGVPRYQDQLNYCIEVARQRDPSASGRVEVAIAVEGGRVRTARVVSNGTGKNELATCLTRTIRRWRFDASVDDQRTWPFVFR